MAETQSLMTFIVAQLGARMHYAVPSILARANLLERLYTDIYAPRAARSLHSIASRHGPAPLARWLGRAPADIPANKIVSFNAMGWEYYWRRRRGASNGSSHGAYLWAGSEFCRRVINSGLGSARVVYAFNSAALELLQYARGNGLFTVIEQTIAPRDIEESLLAREEAEFAGWVPSAAVDRYAAAFSEREKREWETADLILCGSDFVRNSIGAAGGPLDRCRVVQYGISPPAVIPVKDCRHKPLRVLTVGSLSLRKGTPYVLAAARSLKGKAQFRMAGSLDITSIAQKRLCSHVDIVGAVPRSRIHEHFEWADIFLLPSICEGSATACYEALAYGLPVITTPNTGSVVRDNVDGFIVPICDPKAIIERLERLDEDRDLLLLMAHNARLRSADFTLEKYGDRLLSTLSAFDAIS